ncbi:MAG: DUF2079 domain-containing protein [Deltaproteobacteria bacterium]|nr:DUF2079 domain-containing protein [Deltaproteobacteria bacterium]
MVAAAGMAIWRYWAMGNDNYDLAFYTRVVWGLAHADRVNSIVGAHDLGLHFMPVMVLFAPLARILPVPGMLLVAQALALGGVVPLLYLLGRRLSGRPLLGMALAVAWCLHPSVLQIGCREFHPGSLALPALVAALDALHARRDLRGCVLLLVACMAREDVALVAAGAGLALVLEPGRRRLGGCLAAAGAAWFLLYVLVIQPSFLPLTGSIEAHFAGWGHDARQVMGHMAMNPGQAMERMASAGDLAYLPLLLVMLAGLPLLAPRWILPALPAVAINMLSTFPASLDPESHYVTLALPGLFVAAAIGLKRLSSWKPAGSRAFALACAALCLASLRGHAVGGASPLSLSFDRSAYVMDRDEGTLAWYARTLAGMDTLSIMAPASLIAHLAERRHIYSWAFDHPKPDVAILDMTQRQWVQIEPERWDEPMEREIQRLDADPAYGTWRFNPPFRVSWRGAPGGAQRLARVSPGGLPSGARPQAGGWPGYVDLAGLEAALTKEREQWSGRYRSHFVVRTTFYWKVHRPLPRGLLLEVVIRGATKTHTRYHLPTWGVRDTSTWLRGEIIRDEQWSTSPGGWPLEALEVHVRFVDRSGTPYPPGAEPITLAW